MPFAPAGPVQESITEDRIREMITWSPRRSKLSEDWRDSLHEPPDADSNCRVVLPFSETFQNAFKTMYPGTEYHALKVKGERLCVFLNDSNWNTQAVEQTKEWLETVGQYVAIRDCLALSFALDYRTQGGDPDGARTRIGALCRLAKPYSNSDGHDQAAADSLVEACLDFLKTMTCYDSIDSVVAMSPSRPDKPFDLPAYLAGQISSELGKANLCEKVRTVEARNELKTISADNKLDEIKDTIELAGDAFRGTTVLIVDDLYQSGTSMNYLAMLLQQAGAKKLFGLACEKTVRNRDNVS